MNLRGKFLVLSILTFEYHKHVFSYIPLITSYFIVSYILLMYYLVGM